MSDTPAREVEDIRGKTPFARAVLDIWFELEGVDNRWKANWKSIPNVPRHLFPLARARLQQRAKKQAG
jgi:uncharacterized protein (UPF0128 family)